MVSVPDLRTPAIAPGTLGRRAQPTIEARGLTLRPWREQDAGVLVRAYGDPEIRRWHGRSMDAREARERIAESHDGWREETRAEWAVLAGGAEPLARLVLKDLDLRDGSAEVGYWVLPEARGQGIATRALQTLSDAVFAKLGFRRLELEHSCANAASCRVALKAGFTAEGTRRGAVLHGDGWHDMHLHGRLASDTS